MTLNDSTREWTQYNGLKVKLASGWHTIRVMAFEAIYPVRQWVIQASAEPSDKNTPEYREISRRLGGGDWSTDIFGSDESFTVEVLAACRAKIQQQRQRDNEY